jgi:hypothetical protein
MSQLSTGFLSGERYLLIRAFIKDETDENGLAIANTALGVVRSLFQNPIQVVRSNISTLSNINIGISGISLDNNYSSQKMSLPNSRLAYPIPSDKIIEQISVINKKEDTSAGIIKCLDRKLIGLLNSSINLGTNGSSDSIYDIFPKDGPRQRSWIDIRDNIDRWLGDYVIIEVGVITIPAKILPR